jgi:hypothetical protein
MLSISKISSQGSGYYGKDNSKIVAKVITKVVAKVSTKASTKVVTIV